MGVTKAVRVGDDHPDAPSPTSFGPSMFHEAGKSSVFHTAREAGSETFEASVAIEAARCLTRDRLSAVYNHQAGAWTNPGLALGFWPGWISSTTHVLPSSFPEDALLGQTSLVLHLREQAC